MKFIFNLNRKVEPVEAGTTTEPIPIFNLEENRFEDPEERRVTDICIMIRGFTIFSFTWVPSKKYGASWILNIFNKAWEHDSDES